MGGVGELDFIWGCFCYFSIKPLIEAEHHPLFPFLLPITIRGRDGLQQKEGKQQSEIPNTTVSMLWWFVGVVGVVMAEAADIEEGFGR